jgi:hypothetical protein
VTLRIHPLWACVVVGCIAALTVRPALGAPRAPNDAAALKLRDEAIDTDYLATNFAEAAAKLDRALALCRAHGACSPSVRARLLCDLGVIDFTRRRPDASRAHFAAALKEDPDVTLDKDLSSTDVQREFAAAKAGGSGSPPPARSGASSAAAHGDMAHAPITSQALLTPIPIYVELPEGVTADRVVVHYKAPGQTEWKTVRMTKRGNGFGAEIPCMDVGSSRGELKYFVQAADASGDIVASSGRQAEPYTVRIVEHLEGERPHLPDRPPPTACSAAAASDCPPGFPGCGSTSKSSPADACVSDDECSGGVKCVDGQCGGSGGGAPDEAEGEKPHAPIKRNWVSVGFEVDALLLPSATNACAGGSGYTCFNPDGSYYADDPLRNADDEVNGGFTRATERVLFGYDRVVLDKVTLGARLGFALGGGPQRPTAASFMPVHVEARAAYWFGKDPFARSGLRYFVMAAGGMAEVDASVPVDVYANAAAYPNDSMDKRAWKKSGLGFAALGGGAMFAITPSTGIVLEAKIMQMFPTSATGASLQLGYLVGL